MHVHHFLQVIVVLPRFYHHVAQCLRDVPRYDARFLFPRHLDHRGDQLPKLLALLTTLRFPLGPPLRRDLRPHQNRQSN